MTLPYIIALDQGTTSSRAILYDGRGRELRTASRPLPVLYPSSGWVEQNPQEIWSTLLDSLKEVAQGIEPQEVRGIGLTNQRETVLCWDRHSGKPLGPAIVWQCRRTTSLCEQLRNEGLEDEIRRRTGLVLDPYFSGTKIRWLIENIPGIRAKARSGAAVFGTVDSWVLYKLTEGRSFVTEPTNASRTMLYDLERGDWSDELLKLFEVKRENVAAIQSSNSTFATTSVLGKPIPITGILGDQQASLLGHGCVRQNSVKCTFGTGAFMLVNKGSVRPVSESGLLTTIAYDLSGVRTYALEGSVFVAGALIQWLRDELRIIASAEASETIAEKVPSASGVVVVPAFVGLGAPHWDSTARGAIFGLTRNSQPAHIVRAALEGIAHQVADLLEDRELRGVAEIQIDGGMSRNKLFCQILANITGRSIIASVLPEMTAFGVATLARYAATVSEQPSAGSLIEWLALGQWKIGGGDQGSLERRYEPTLPAHELNRIRQIWSGVIAAVRSVPSSI